jgi:hypothetical protein
MPLSTLLARLFRLRGHRHQRSYAIVSMPLDRRFQGPSQQQVPNPGNDHRVHVHLDDVMTTDSLHCEQRFIDDPPAYDQYDENGDFISIHRRLPPYSNNDIPSYCPLYHRVCLDDLDSVAFVLLMGDFDDEFWWLQHPPCDINDASVQMYIGRRVIAIYFEEEERHSHCTRVVSYDVPHDDHVAIIVEQEGTSERHTLLIPNRYVDRDLLEVIYRREAMGELELDRGAPMADSPSMWGITQ